MPTLAATASIAAIWSSAEENTGERTRRFRSSEAVDGGLEGLASCCADRIGGFFFRREFEQRAGIAARNPGNCLICGRHDPSFDTVTRSCPCNMA